MESFRRQTDTAPINNVGQGGPKRSAFAEGADKVLKPQPPINNLKKET